MKFYIKHILLIILALTLGTTGAFAVIGYRNLFFGKPFEEMVRSVQGSADCDIVQSQLMGDESGNPTSFICVPGFEVLGQRRPSILLAKDGKFVGVILLLGTYTRDGFSIFHNALSEKYKVSKKLTDQESKQFNAQVINEAGVEYDDGTVYLQLSRDKQKTWKINLNLIYRDKSAIPKKKSSGL